VAVTALIAAIGPLSAAELPKEGKYDFSDCGVATGLYGIEFSRTNVASSYKYVGTNRSNPPGGMFDMTSFKCVALNTTINAKQSATGVCEVLDKDGDKLLTRYDTDAQGETERVGDSGTGKYEGVISCDSGPASSPIRISSSTSLRQAEVPPNVKSALMLIYALGCVRLHPTLCGRS
jgi:hypothetical protein